jgi:DNA-binding XRE family transcriptional regulator
MAIDPDELDDDARRFAPWFRRERERVFGTQRRAAIALDVAIETIRNYERGESLPNFRALQKICRAFGLPDPLPLAAEEPDPDSTPPDGGSLGDSTTGR